MSLVVIAAAVMTGCSSTRHVPPGRYLLDEVKIEVHDTTKTLTSKGMMSYVRQRPNNRTLHLVRMRLGIYNISGKDSTKVDRSASYAARNIAATIVKSGLYKKAEVQLSYAIGVKDPVSIHVDTFGEEKISEEKLIEWIRKEWDLSPKGIIETFSLRSPIFLSTAQSGHFGHSEFSWEKIDEKKVENLLSIS